MTVFDLKTLKQTAKIKIEGENPDAILYDPFSKRVFTFNGRSKNATVIDATNDKVVGNIPLDGKPEFGAADGKGMVYVNIEDKSEVTSIDAKKAAVVKSWPLAPCEEPSGLAMDQKHRRLFSGCGNKMMAVMDADSGKVIATPAIGEGVDANAFDADQQYAFSSNGRDGNLTIVHEDSPDKFSVVENAPTQKVRPHDGVRHHKPRRLSGHGGNRGIASRKRRRASAAQHEARNIYSAGGGEEVAKWKVPRRLFNASVVGRFAGALPDRLFQIFFRQWV